MLSAHSSITSFHSPAAVFFPPLLHFWTLFRLCQNGFKPVVSLFLCLSLQLCLGLSLQPWSNVSMATQTIILWGRESIRPSAVKWNRTLESEWAVVGEHLGRHSVWLIARIGERAQPVYLFAPNSDGHEVGSFVHENVFHGLGVFFILCSGMNRCFRGGKTITKGPEQSSVLAV